MMQGFNEGFLEPSCIPPADKTDNRTFVVGATLYLVNVIAK